MIVEKNYFSEKQQYNASKFLRKYKFLRTEIIGKSNCQRSIKAFSVGNPSNQVLFCGAFHGMESITSYVLYKFLHDVCNSIQNSQALCDIHLERFLNKRGLVVIPCVNPDGVEIFSNGPVGGGRYENHIRKIMLNNNSQKWQANAVGVDINHNFDANWEELHALEIANNITSPAPTRYGGPFPESEVETRNIVNFCKNNYIRHALAFHSQGEEIYWNFGEKTPEKSLQMANVMAKCSGYKLATPSGLSSGGGFKDWFINYFERPAFTIEIGKGENPLDFSQKDLIYDKIKEMMTLSLIM